MRAAPDARTRARTHPADSMAASSSAGSTTVARRPPASTARVIQGSGIFICKSIFENTGKSSGGAWGAGFLATVEAGVPAQLVGMLANLVTPAVMANLAAQGSRTGAQ